ncbi:multiple antibiotic resistance protein [Methanohalophilus levihalophilus]|uniref:MarC family protein n=1 Tax=Methanohalophilus levihalophilus TaxID=1431282 RepID=UPI001AE4E934|nr:MarC family protein [Methanohalophilus levihalophilus]MBP2030247.1 multiple antibiotic resistance protein [Methanohalophilus levihalophilus]
MDLLSYFIYSLVSLFVIVSPIGVLITFISLTSNMTLQEKNHIAKRAVVLACVIALFFAVTGDSILDFFGIGVDTLRVAGGILLFKIAFDMMLAHVSRESITEGEISESMDREDIWIFPIAMPMMTGPGTITTVILLSGSSESILHQMVVILAILLTFVICLFTLYFSRRIYKFIGYSGTLVVSRLLGLFLAALAVDFITKGVWNIYTGFLL